MFISTNGGLSFTKTTAQGVGENHIRWIMFDPYDPQYVYAAGTSGVLRSHDRGRTWDFIYYTAYEKLNNVQSISIDPHDRRRGFIGTQDGALMTDDIRTCTTDSWRRIGGMRFTSHMVYRIAVNPARKGHIWATTNAQAEPIFTDPARKFWDMAGAFIWESIDNGKTWRVIFSGHTKGSAQWFDWAPDDPSLLWITWSRALHRMRRIVPGEKHKSRATKAGLEIAQSIADRRELPPIGHLTLAATRFLGSEAGIILEYRELAALKALVPRVDLTATYLTRDFFGRIDDGVYPILRYRRLANGLPEMFDFRAMVKWDLQPLVFNLETTLFGRVNRVAAEMRFIQVWLIPYYYSEFARLHARILADPPRSLRTRLFYRMRLEELEAYLDFLSGGYITAWRQGGKPDPLKTKRFTRWEGTGKFPNFTKEFLDYEKNPTDRTPEN